MQNNKMEVNISALDAESTEDILYRVGIHLSGKNIFPPSRQVLIAAARKWFDGQREAFATAICQDHRIQAMSRQDATHARRLELVSATADLIISLCGGIPPVVVATLVVREGLHLLCVDYWKGPEEPLL